MTSAEEVTLAVVQALVAVGVPVFRERITAMQREEVEILLVETDEEDSTVLGENFDGYVYRNDLTVRVSAVVRQESGYHASVDVLREQSHLALVNDPALRLLVAGIKKTRARWQPQEADITAAFSEQTYVLTYDSTQQKI